MEKAGLKSKAISKGNSTTRSLDTRSTSCDRDEEQSIQQARNKLLKGMGFTYTSPQPFQLGLGHKKEKNSSELTEKNIETVLEEEESEPQKEEEVKPRLHLFFDRQEYTGGISRRRGSLPVKSSRSRSTELLPLPDVDETKEEYFYDLHQKMAFGRKLNILFDRSEKKPSTGDLNEKRSSIIAPDCLTIEEEDAENIQIDPIDLLSNDNESSSKSRLSSPLSKPLSKKHLFVDEFSADGEGKKRAKFEQSIEPIIEEKANEEEEAPKHNCKKIRIQGTDNLVQIVRSDMVIPQDSEILDVIEKKGAGLAPTFEDEITEEANEEPLENTEPTHQQHHINS